MKREAELIRVSEGEKIQGYEVVQVGIDESGKYKEIKTPSGEIEKVYCIGYKDIEKFFVDKYNTIHNYRRDEDNIVLYFNIDTGDIMVIAVKVDDDLTTYPFNLQNSFVVEKGHLESPDPNERKGIVPITKENLDILKDRGILSDETSYVLFFNRRNVGFYI